MSDITINGVNSGIGTAPAKSSPASSGSTGFDAIMQEVSGKLSQVQNDAEKATAELVSGGDVTQAIIAMEKADMNFQLMVEVRNKLLSAYQEIMRMQV